MKTYLTKYKEKDIAGPEIKARCWDDARRIAQTMYEGVKIVGEKHGDQDISFN